MYIQIFKRHKKELSPVEMSLFFFLCDFLLFVGEVKLQQSPIPHTYELSPTEVVHFNTDTQKKKQEIIYFC